jgi:anti-sigma regulatory factor (Ser/Thr protein kinase)
MKRERRLKNSKLFFISFPARKRYLQIAREFVRTICALHGLDDEVAEDFVYMVGEGASNVVKHAYPDLEAENAVVEISLKVEPHLLTMAIRDYGRGFDEKKYHKLDFEDIKSKVKNRHKGGLGLFMIDRLADTLTISIDPYHKNELIIVKKI